MPPTTTLPANPAAPPAPGAEDQVFIARQPIFDAQSQIVYGYELLFRSSDENKYTATDGRFASSQTINRALHSIGLDAVCGDKKAFVNITRDLLLEEVYTLLPPEQCVVEVLEDMTLDDEVIGACKKLRAAGYGLALDDVTSVERVKPLWGVADIIKVDLSLIARENRASVLKELAAYAGKLLAEKVETREDLDEAVALGCEYVQGYFFCRPEMMRGRGLTGAEVIYLQFLRELNKPQLDYAVLEQIIKQDVSLAYKLLKYLNSAGLGLRNKVSSIQQALVMMGERPLRKWGSLVVVTSMNSQRPPELLLTALVRAHFCEAVARKLKLVDQQLEMFLIGLLSSMDVALGVPMTKVLEQTGVSDVVRCVLLQDANAPKDLAKIYTLSVACERGAWGTVVKTSAGLRLTQGDIAAIYYAALAWANHALAAAAA
ncbi:MAG TPA: EAL domain-containing protein [Tepidisphaeraceae bacterium]|nr:EAL domain-containing protein [Tepidisphaeraceae bacterium]